MHLIQERRLAQKRLVADRYVKAVELLAADEAGKSANTAAGESSQNNNKKEAVRSGGIFSLEQIAEDSRRDQCTITGATHLKNEQK